jgi:mono/diheme cytochrome c family protein
MIRAIGIAVVVVGLAGLAAFYLLTMPRTIAAADIPDHAPDLVNGERMFWAGGCESCHAAPGATGDDRLKLGGGQILVSQFGNFHVPNISPDKDRGIGAWTLVDFVNAMKRGIGPGGVHLYPAFPYTSYQHMKIEDIVDLKAFLDRLPAVTTASQAHELPFPFNIRRGVGLWQLLHVDGKTFVPDPQASDEVNRGAYLVQAPGHCGECHTPRGFDGGMIAAKFLSGGPSPEGKGRIPNITPHPDGIADWTNDDIVAALETGMMPTGDVFGSVMGAVQANLARLPKEEIAAIAAYLKTVPPLPGKRQPGG